MAKEIFVSFGVDIDAVAGWLGSYGGEDSPDDISRGLFAGEVGVPRILELFRREGLTQTFFWPGHSIDTFPEQFDACVAAGHEIGVHGYSHENPIAMTREQESAVLDRCMDLIEKRAGRRPTGYVAPWRECSPVTNELLLERGITYDHAQAVSGSLGSTRRLQPLPSDSTSVWPLGLEGVPQRPTWGHFRARASGWQYATDGEGECSVVGGSDAKKLDSLPPCRTGRPT